MQLNLRTDMDSSILKNLLIYISLFVISTSLLAQKLDYKSYNLRPPLDIPLILAGNCGELRNNHFHAGIDIKTNQRTGYSIYSVEDGYISRIKISPWGYGHAVYVTHYNGLTTVYAHCESFVGEVQKLAYSQQIKQESFTIDYVPKADSLKVKKGQIIAKSGNTGSSTAPHLHFEIRDSETEHVYNPLLFNFDIQDDLPPVIRNVKVYQVTEKGYRVPNRSKTYNVTGNNGVFSIQNNKMVLDASFASENGGIGFAFNVNDYLNAANNICGIFESYLLLEGDTIFSQNMEEMSFETNRQINTHKDYEEFQQRRKHFHKSFKTTNNPLPIYRKTMNNGVINVQPGQNYTLKYIVKDAYGNKSQLEFDVSIEDGIKTKGNGYNLSQPHLYPDSSFLSYNENYYLMFPTGILYEPTPLLISSSKNSLLFGKDNVPLQDSYKIMMPIVDTKYVEKNYLLRTASNGRKYAEYGVIKDGWITSRVKSFGRFSVQIDTIAPTIRGINFANDAFVGHKKLIWDIQDEESGLKSYKIFIDSHYYLLEYEPKNSSFFFYPPKDLEGEKKVIIEAVDNCGNTNQRAYTLIF